MSKAAFEQGDWAAVIEAHPLESHDPSEWLRYGAALLHAIEPGPEQGRQQQQQAALAFEQAKREAASTDEVDMVKRAVLQYCLKEALQLVVEG